MSLHVTCGLSDPTTGLLRADSLAWSETLPTSGNRTTNTVPADGRPYVLHLVAEVKMYVAAGPGGAADASGSRRRLLMPSGEIALSAPAGSQVHWITKA